MSSNTVHEFPTDTYNAPPLLRPTRPFYWTVLREMWENRSIYIAPLIVAGVVLFATAVSMLFTPYRLHKNPGQPEKQVVSMVKHISMSPAPIMMATILVAFFYALDALYGERRDRSILFWKSLPVSDAQTVLAKVAIPILVLPSIGYVLSVIVQIILMNLGTVILMANRIGGAGTLWSRFGFFEGLIIMAYGLSAHALWYAPIYCWLLLIGAWAKRAPFLWAVMPWLLISAFERMAFGSMSFMYMLQYRVTGAMKEGFVGKALKKTGGDVSKLSQLNPINFYLTPGLWVGLLFAAACVALAIYVRRNREPI